MQSKCFSDIYETNRSLVISAPTAAGKTVLLELAIVRNYLNVSNPTEKWVVYLSPTKALCSEKCEEWKSKFYTHGLNVMECTGDSEFTSWRELE